MSYDSFNEMTEFWREENRENQERKAESRGSNIEIFEEIFNNDDDFLVEKRTDYHFSLFKNNERVDYWPTSGKAKNITFGSKIIKTGHPNELRELFNH